MGGAKRPADISHSLCVFMQKGSAADDFIPNARGVYRHPTELRPLSLKNADSKIVAGIANWCIKPATSAGTMLIQRGLVMNRQVIENVVNLDFQARQSAFAFQFRTKTTLAKILMT